MTPAFYLSSLAASALLGWYSGKSESTPEAKMETTPVEKIDLADAKFKAYIEDLVGEKIRESDNVFGEKTALSSKLIGVSIAAVPGLVDSVALWMALRDPTSTVVTKVIIAAALLYLVSPLDLIPDEAVPIIGEVDDIAVIKAAAKAVAASIHPRHYREAKEWFESQGIDMPYYEPVIDRIGRMATPEEGRP